MSEMPIQQAIPLSSLKEDLACSQNQKFKFPSIDNGTSSSYGLRSKIIKDTIRYALMYNVKGLTHTAKAYEAAVMQYMMTRYDEVGFLIYQQKQEQLLWDHRIVMRYLESEYRMPSFPEPEVVHLADGYDVKVSPDFVFTTGNKIEVVFLKTSRPYVIQRRENGSFNRDLQLYAGILYGRQFGYTNITSSFYFLKKKSDSNQWYKCDQNFFGDSNIVSLSDIGDGKTTSLDAEVGRYIDELQCGIDANYMPAATCEKCVHYDICKYQLPGMLTDSAELPNGNSKKIDYTSAQTEVINQKSGVTRVIAAAGSGKTQTVAGRVSKLIQDGTKPENILCITFSNAGAQEMRRKIEKQIMAEGSGIDISKMKIMTFHAFEYEIAKANWKELGYKRTLTVIDNVQKSGIIRDILKKQPIYEWGGKSFLNFTSSKSWSGDGAIAIVSDVFTQIKEQGGDPADVTAASITVNGDVDSIVIHEIIKRYDYYTQECKARGLVDYDDMELLAFQILDNHANYLGEHYQFEHIIIDEFQDTAEWQMELVKRLRQIPTFKSLMIVGDDAQAIYGFRNTSPEYILNFQSKLNAPFEYKNKHTVQYVPNNDNVLDIMLTDNWRSKQEILDFASLFLEENKGQIQKHINAARGSGGKVNVQGYKSEKDEYAAIANSIKMHHKQGTAYEDIAVLAFKKNELKKIADALTAAHIPSVFCAPESMIENSRVRAVLSFAKVLENPNDMKDAAICANALYRAEDTENTLGLMDLKEEALKRVEAVLERASAIRKETSEKKKKEKFLAYVKDISLEDETVTHFAEQFENMDYDDVLHYCRDFELFGEDNMYRRLGEYPGVKLITSHSSKGLEWDIVYFTVNGINEQLRKRDCEETHRLEFVSMTRARDELYVSGTYQRKDRDSYQYVTNTALHDAYFHAGKAADWNQEMWALNTSKSGKNRK